MTLRVIWLFIGAAAAALAVAMRAPLAATVLGLMAFGVLHNVLELRYVGGRFAAVLSGRLLFWLLGLVTVIVLCRLAGMVVGEPARLAEIVVGYAVLGAACATGLRGPSLLAAAAVLAIAAAASLSWPAYHFVVLTHLHNVVPLFFLWEWAARLPTPALRRWFRSVQIGWVLVIPAVLLTGALDPYLGGTGSSVAGFAGNPRAIVAASAPPAAVVTDVGVRLLVVFAFLLPPDDALLRLGGLLPPLRTRRRTGFRGARPVADRLPGVGGGWRRRVGPGRGVRHRLRLREGGVFGVRELSRVPGISGDPGHVAGDGCGDQAEPDRPETRRPEGGSAVVLEVIELGSRTARPPLFVHWHEGVMEPGWPNVATRIHRWLQTRDQPI